MPDALHPELTCGIATGVYMSGLDSHNLKKLTSYVSTYLGALRSLRVDLNGVETRYLEAGKGETIVFLHALGASKTHWCRLMRALSDQYHVVSVDIPGLCLADKLPENRHTFRHLSDWLDSFLDHLNIEKTHLFGHSSGAALAAYFAGGRSARVQSLSMVGISGLANSESAGSVYNLTDLKLRTVEDVDRMIQVLFYKKPELPTVVKKKYIKDYASFEKEFEPLLRDISISSLQVMPRLRLLKCPTLLFCGDHDQICPPEFLRNLSRVINHSEMVVLENCAHLAYMEDAEGILKHYSRFLRENLTASAGQFNTRTLYSI